MSDFGIMCICLLIGYIVRTFTANRSAAVVARLDACEERIDVIDDAVFEEDNGDDDGPDGGEELPEEKPVLRLVGGDK